MSTFACFVSDIVENSKKIASANYNVSMARIPATSNRSSKNVRNGPSPLQLRVSSLVREARWLLFVVLAAWLGLVLSTWDPADPSWTQSLHAGSIKNKRSEEHTSELQS